MGEWKSLKTASGTGWKEIDREAGTGWKALDWESAYEDFTTFTEVDIGADRIQKSATHIDHLSYRDETTYLYKDYGTGHFGDFTHKVKAKRVTSVTDGIAAFWMVSNDLGDIMALRNASKNFIYIIFYHYDGTIKIRVYEAYNGSIYYDTYNTSSSSSWRYVKIVKSGTSLKVYIYSDENYSTLLDTLTRTLHENGSYIYLYGCNTFNTSTSGKTMDMDVENCDLG